MFYSERYRIIQPLLKNSKETKYLVFDEMDKCKKVISENIGKFESGGDIEQLSGIEHTGLPKITDYFEVNECCCIVQEYIEGESLKNYVERRGVLDLYEALDIFIKLLYIVKFLHDIKPISIIHGSIHHDNVILIEDNVYLTDYGIKEEKKNPYQAPEAILGIKKSKQQDIYSLGMLLNFMITGGFKKPGYSQKSLTGTDSLIARCTNANFNNRFEDTGILITECERLARNLTKDSSQPMSKLIAVNGCHDAVFELAQSLGKALSENVLIIDADILQPSFEPDSYILNDNLQSMMDRTDKGEDINKALKKAKISSKVYIIPSVIRIEGYENITFTSFYNLLIRLAEDFKVIFIKCSDFIYDSLTVNTYIISDQIVYIMSDPLNDMLLFNEISRYLCERHDIDNRRFNAFIYKKRIKNIVTAGIKENLYGEYLGYINSRSRGYAKDLTGITDKIRRKL
ncbi:MAG TPA: protein kinase [Clostridia bacterium]|nr:MAG: Serine/threonine-protein kinase PrkC [Firmicutes bacterium ADurb.Bin099]HNZ41203.1 protein kinase [Clostridia bacterium]HPY98507.1 protein kinase [Clostridia bacterium]HQC68399.1 protein kinase [Clostridia bacterium]